MAIYEEDNLSLHMKIYQWEIRPPATRLKLWHANIYSFYHPQRLCSALHYCGHHLARVGSFDCVAADPAAIVWTH